MKNMALVPTTTDVALVVLMNIMYLKSLILQSWHPAGDFALLSRVARIRHKIDNGSL